MSEHYIQTIAALTDDIARIENETAEKKKMVNYLCELAGQPRAYDEIKSASRAKSFSIKKDQFYGKTLNGSIRDVLTLYRNADLELPTAEQIYEAVLSGGYDEFPKNRDEAITGLKITLGKSTNTFTKLNGGSYGLNEWYNKKVKHQAKKSNPSSAGSEGETDGSLASEDDRQEDPAN